MRLSPRRILDYLHLHRLSDMNRRSFLKLAGFGLVAPSVGIGVDHALTTRQKIPGKVLFDGHVSIGSGKFSVDELMRVVVEVGLVSFTSTNRRQDVSYNEFINSCPQGTVRELTRGILAEVTFEGKTGYVLKSQYIEPLILQFLVPVAWEIHFLMAG